MNILILILYVVVYDINPFVNTQPEPQYLLYSGIPYCRHRASTISEKPLIKNAFMVSLRQKTESYYYHVCTGTLFSPMWVLTAGHCYDEDIYLYAVENYRITNKNQEKFEGSTTLIIKGYRHPNYDSNTLNHNIVLLQLLTSIRRAGYVSSVKFPRSSTIGDLYDAIGEEMVFIGWDNWNISSYFSSQIYGQRRSKRWLDYPYVDWWLVRESEKPFWKSTILCVNVKLMPISKCKSIYEALTANVKKLPIHENNACTLDEDSWYWADDSGSPLLYKDIQFGILSWGRKERDQPGVVVRVDRYLEWIEKTSKVELQKKSILSSSSRKLFGTIFVISIFILILYILT